MAQSEQELAAQRIGKGNKAKTKQAFYKLQREHAEESGDQATTDKIYAKLGKKSHSVDSSRGDKAILAAAPFIPEAVTGLGEMAAARGVGALGKMIPRVGRGEAREAGESSTAMVPRTKSGPPSKSYQHLGRATPVKKALPSKGRALGSATSAPKIGSSTSGKALSGKSGAKAVTSGSQKALPTSEHKDYSGELARLSKAPKKVRAVRAPRAPRKKKTVSV